jgi:hypothetical protein
MKLVSDLTAKRLRESAKAVVTAIAEFLQDVKHVDIANAVRGRRESNLRAYKDAVVCARKGDKLAEFLLPFHRFILSISEEEASEVRINLANEETGSKDY